MSERDRLVHSLIVINRADFHSRPQVLRNISKSCKEECLALYEHCLKDENAKVRLQAAKILVELQGVDALELITPLQQDSDWFTRRCVKRMIKNLNAKRSS